MADFLMAVFGGILVLAALQAFLPVVVGALDALLVFIVKAPFRFLAHRLRSHAHLTPYRRGLRRATEGTFLLAACSYAASWFPALLGRDLGDLAQAFWRAPADRPGVGVFFAVAALGLVWVIAGLRGTRGGDRDWMAALWSALVAGGCVALFWWHWFPPPDRTFTTLLEIAALKTFYVAGAAAGLVRFWLTLPLFGNAMRIVARHIRQQAVVWRSARS